MNDLNAEEQKLMNAIVATHKLISSVEHTFGFGQPVQVTGRIARVKLTDAEAAELAGKPNRIWRRTQMIVPFKAIFLGRCVISDGDAWIETGTNEDPEYSPSYSVTKAHRAALIAFKSINFPYKTTVEKVFLEDVWAY